MAVSSPDRRFTESGDAWQPTFADTSLPLAVVVTETRWDEPVNRDPLTLRLRYIAGGVHSIRIGHEQARET